MNFNLLDEINKITQTYCLVNGLPIPETKMDHPNDFPYYKKGYVGTLKHEDDKERANEELDGRIDTLTEQLYGDYIKDADVIYEVLTNDTDVLVDLSAVLAEPEFNAQAVQKIVEKYVMARAEEDSREKLGG